MDPWPGQPYSQIPSMLRHSGRGHTPGINITYLGFRLLYYTHLTFSYKTLVRAANHEAAQTCRHNAPSVA